MAEEHPQIREDLTVSQQRFEGETYYVIKDPLTKKFFRVKEYEYFIIQNLNGENSPEKIREIFESRFKIKLKPEVLDKFIRNLKKSRFLETETTRRELSKVRYEAEKERYLLKKILFIKVKAFDPDKFLTGLLKNVRFFYTKKFAYLSLLLIFLALIITISNWSDLGYSLKKLYHPSTLLKLWVAIFLMGFVHELGHALTCKYFGGEVREMGFLLIYLQPAFYTNVSDAWMFPEKKKKLLVSLAGPFIHMVMWALATILWRITALDTQLNSFLLVFMIASGILLLFNFNPLIKLDGYYILSDHLEIPNLRKKAFGFLNSLFKRKILKLDVPKIDLPQKQRKTFLVYGFFSILYSVLLLGYIFFKVEKFLVSQLNAYGLFLFLGILYIIFKNPVQIFLAGALNFFLFKKDEMKKPKKLFTYGIVIIAILLFLFLFPIELRISSECQIQPLESYTLMTLPEGYLQENLLTSGSEEKKKSNFLKLIPGDYGVVNLESKLKEGDKVKKGEVIATFASVQYQTQLKGISAKIEKAQAHLDYLLNLPKKEELQKAQDKVKKAEIKLAAKEKELKRAQNLHKDNLISDEMLEKIQTDHSVLKKEKQIAQNDLSIIEAGAEPEKIKMAQAELEELKAEKEALEYQIDASVIKSHISGVVTQARFDSTFLKIENLDTVRVLIKVSEKDMDVARPDLKVKVKVRSYPFESFYGKVSEVPFKSEILGKKTVFLVTSKIQNDKDLLRSGMTGHAKIYCGKRSLIYVLTRGIIHYLRVEFWSWW